MSGKWILLALPFLHMGRPIFTVFPSRRTKIKRDNVELNRAYVLFLQFVLLVQFDNDSSKKLTRFQRNILTDNDYIHLQDNVCNTE